MYIRDLDGLPHIHLLPHLLKVNLIRPQRVDNAPATCEPGIVVHTDAVLRARTRLVSDSSILVLQLTTSSALWRGVLRASSLAPRPQRRVNGVR